MDTGTQTARNRLGDSAHKLTQLKMALYNAVHDRITDTVWAAADRYDELTLIGAVRLREKAIKLQSAFQFDNTIPLGLRIRRIGTGAAGVLAILFLAVAPTGAAHQFASYPIEEEAVATFSAPVIERTDSSGTVLFTAMSENESLPDKILSFPVSVFIEETEDHEADSLLYSSIFVFSYDDADIAEASDDESALLSGQDIHEALHEESADLAMLSNEMPAASLSAVYYAPVGPHAMIQPVYPENARHEPEPESDQLPAANNDGETGQPSETSSIFVLNPESDNDEYLDAGDNGYAAEGIGDGTGYSLSTASTGYYIWPTEGNLSSLFGRRSTTIGSTNHLGIDISGRSGTLIHAADGGEVILSGWNRTFGYYIKIKHDNGQITLYAHCSALLVSEGERVWQGQEIAHMGRTGTASGVHLHYELIINDVNVDPLGYLPAL